MSPWLSDLFLSSQSDERLVTLARSGHERAFVVIVERYRPQLLGRARQLTNDRRAEDLVQQTFLDVFAALQSGTKVIHLRGWLHQVLRNTAIRMGSNTPVEAELDPERHPTEPLEDAVETSMLAYGALAEMAKLPARQREAFMATAIQGRSRNEIAMTMGLSEGSVRQLVHRARASVRTAVTAITPYPLARCLASARSPLMGNGVQETAIAAGAASGGGVAVKVGALLASGVIATGIVSSHVARHHARQPAGTSHAARASVRAGRIASAGVLSTPGSGLIRVGSAAAPAVDSGGRAAAPTRSTQHLSTPERSGSGGDSRSKRRGDGGSSGGRVPDGSGGNTGGDGADGGGSGGGSSGQSSDGSGSGSGDGGGGGGNGGGGSQGGGGSGSHGGGGGGHGGAGSGSGGGGSNSSGGSGGGPAIAAGSDGGSGGGGGSNTGGGGSNGGGGGSSGGGSGPSGSSGSSGGSDD